MAELASSKLRVRTAFNSFRLKAPRHCPSARDSIPSTSRAPSPHSSLSPGTRAVPAAAPCPPRPARRYHGPGPARRSPGPGPCTCASPARRPPPARLRPQPPAHAGPLRRLPRCHPREAGPAGSAALGPCGAWAVSARSRPSLLPRREEEAAGPRGARSLTGGAPAARRVRCLPRRRTPAPARPLSPGRPLYLCVPRPPAPGGAAGPAQVRAVLARAQVRAAPRWPPPAAAAARSRTRSAASSADMLEPSSPRPRHRARESWAGPGSPRPPHPTAHWPPATSAQPFLAVIGRCVRRSHPGPAQKLFSDWVSPACFGNYWLRLSSVKTTAQGLRLSPHFFFPASQPRAGLTEAAVSEQPRPFQPPSRRHIPSLPAARFACRPLAPSAATPAASLAPAAASPRGREPTRGLLFLIGRCSCQSSAAGGAAERGPARAPSRSARRLVAGRARGARPPPCPTGGSGEYPYVRAITSPPANQGARGQVSRPRGAGPGAPGGTHCTSHGPGGGSRDPGSGVWHLGLLSVPSLRLPVWAAGVTAAKSQAGGVSVLYVPICPRRRSAVSPGSGDTGAAAPLGCPSEASRGRPWYLTEPPDTGVA